jgi:hypothetical protein
MATPKDVLPEDESHEARYEVERATNNCAITQSLLYYSRA